jgi:hypothetical protein
MKIKTKATKKPMDFRPKCWVCNERINIDNEGHTLWLEGGKPNLMSHLSCGIVKMRTKTNKEERK